MGTGMDKISFKFSGMTLVGPDDDPLVKATFAVMVEGKKSGSVSITEPTSLHYEGDQPRRISIQMAAQNAQASLARILQDAVMELHKGNILPPVRG